MVVTIAHIGTWHDTIFVSAKCVKPLVLARLCIRIYASRMGCHLSPRIIEEKCIVFSYVFSVNKIGVSNDPFLVIAAVLSFLDDSDVSNT